MEEEFDIRPYIKAFLANWHWVAIVGGLTAAIAFVIGSIAPPVYETTALIAVTEPRQLLQFDAGFEDVADITSRPLSAYPEIATSSEMLLGLLAQTNSQQIKTLDDLQSFISAEVGRDPSLLRLKVRLKDPHEAAALANAWAELFIEKANNVYGGAAGESLGLYEAQLADARESLETVEDEIIAFEASNQAIIFTNELDDLRLAQSEDLAKQRAISLLLEDIRGFRAQTAEAFRDGSQTLADQLTLLGLQLRAYNVDAPPSLLIQFEGYVPLPEAEQASIVDNLDGLIAMLEGQSSFIASELASLEPTIIELQTELRRINTVYERLLRDKVAAQQVYDALTRKAEEARLTSQDNDSGVRLVSRAPEPVSPTSLEPLLIAVLAGFASILLYSFVFLVRQWWIGNSLVPAQPLQTFESRG